MWKFTRYDGHQVMAKVLLYWNFEGNNWFPWLLNVDVNYIYFKMQYSNKIVVYLLFWIIPWFSFWCTLHVLYLFFLIVHCISWYHGTQFYCRKKAWITISFQIFGICVMLVFFYSICRCIPAGFVCRKLYLTYLFEYVASY